MDTLIVVNLGHPRSSKSFCTEDFEPLNCWRCVDGGRIGGGGKAARKSSGPGGRNGRSPGPHPLWEDRINPSTPGGAVKKTGPREVLRKLSSFSHRPVIFGAVNWHLSAGTLLMRYRLGPLGGARVFFRLRGGAAASDFPLSPVQRSSSFQAGTLTRVAAARHRRSRVTRLCASTVSPASVCARCSPRPENCRNCRCCFASA